MKYGAPTHRLEEHLQYLAHELQIEAQFLYTPGYMLIFFVNPATHTTGMKVVHQIQGLDLGKLRDLHDVYKDVTQDKMDVKAASELLQDLWNKKQRYPPWLCVILYGCASATVGPFAFNARPIDMPVAFFLGYLLGFMQLIVAPRSELYSNLSMILAVVVTSFLARAFGSIRGGNLFCFPALAQSAISLILPGYTILCSAFELQSRNMAAGSVRMMYAIIYSLLLGYGNSFGTTLYGIVDPHANTKTACPSQPLSTHLKFLFVPPFALCLIIINQGKWRQVPLMITISFAGYVVDFFSALYFSGNPLIANTLGALAIGILGSLYSRLARGASAAIILPAIFVQVPSGLAASGSLISGIDAVERFRSGDLVPPGLPIETSLVISMVKIALGLSIGLSLSSLLIYPLGKKRSGLFGF